MVDESVRILHLESSDGVLVKESNGSVVCKEKEIRDEERSRRVEIQNSPEWAPARVPPPSMSFAGIEG